MKKWVSSLTGLALVFSTAALAENSNKELSKGEAKTFKGELVYVEKHTSEFDENNSLQKLETRYFDGETNFGYFKTDYTRHSYLPSYEFKDMRRHRQVNVTVKEGVVYSTIRMGKDAEPKSKTYPMKKNLIAGQGLHNYMRDHIDEFTKNPERVDKIDFLIPLNEDSYSFRVRVKKLDREKNTITYRVEADSWLMRMVAPDIDVTYNTETRQLMVYDGPSNLLSPEGDKMDVVITYDYSGNENTKSVSDDSVAKAD